jgi:hypothetical protein
MKKWWLMKAVKIVIVAAVGITVFGFVLMKLWNALIPEIFNAHEITFIQGIGLLVLARLLFGGFGHRWGGRSAWKGRWKERLAEKYANMTPEQREAFKANWKNRCGCSWDDSFIKKEEAKS